MSSCGNGLANRAIGGTVGSAPGPTVCNDYGRTLLLPLIVQSTTTSTVDHV